MHTTSSKKLFIRPVLQAAVFVVRVRDATAKYTSTASTYKSDMSGNVFFTLLAVQDRICTRVFAICSICQHPKASRPPKATGHKTLQATIVIIIGLA